MEAPLLELRNVDVSFGSQPILRGINLTIRSGETVSIIGESGCGKTVLLKLLVGLLQPSAGEILFEGADLGDLSTFKLGSIRRRIGFLFQGAALFDSLTVYENIAFGVRLLRKFDEKHIREIVHLHLAEVGLPENSVSKMPSELSGGMKKRVGLARALALNPDVMLYDEPTTGLDPIMTDVINDLILQTRAKRPLTSVVVTHEMRTVRKVADRVLMLFPASRLTDSESQVLFDGSVAGLADASDPRIKQFIEGDARVLVKT
ncbi:ATP-binding cassette domain-containing protein [Telmatocola sphagniphila]|uniref:ATP-binding cassette domain-containing protein n=1 Tax=Telmatocola sphagniphila TaxID=1123043 RepID=A0A8E6B844_9BACT|nr:ATP-binding cassette domain-containing protein [Telmatocola sphagniphila]QVL32871.1 ATP-binding cassette domain-containing protein [Telmatocola sphagniphila]